MLYETAGNEAPNKYSQIKSLTLKVLPQEAMRYHEACSNVILAYSRYDDSIDDKNEYLVRVVASVVFNCSGDEVSSFWILVSLIENYELREFYQEDCPGVALYGEVLSTLLDDYIPQIGKILKKYNISSYEFFADWIQDLLVKRIPLKLQQEFFENFLKYGWSYFFRVCLTIMFSMKNEIV